MANPAADAAKREVIVRGLRKIRPGETISRVQLFGDHAAHKEVQKKVLHTLVELKILKRMDTGHPSMVLYLLQDQARLDRLLADENSVTALIWPGTGFVLPPAPDEESLPTVMATQTKTSRVASQEVPAQDDVLNLLRQILERQDLILQKVVDPIGENIIWVRDRVIELQTSTTEIKSIVDKLLEILRKLE